MIDLSKPPYCLIGDWAGNDATATDWTTVLRAAIAAATDGDGLVDLGYTNGNTLVFPKGSFMISDRLVLPPGVALQGSGDYATSLIVKKTFPTDKDVIDLGDSTLHTAAFGNKIRNMNIWNHPDAPMSLKSLVYTNNAQDTDAILDGVRLYGFNRRAFWGEIGYGGASIITLRQVTTNCCLPGAGMIINYGEGTQVNLEGIEPAGGRKSLDPNSPDYNLPAAGTCGLYLAGGYISVRHSHVEQCESGIMINLATAKCLADIAFCTGGPQTTNLITVFNNAAQLNRICLSRVQPNGIAGHTVVNGQPGASAIDGEIKGPLWL